MLLDVITDDQRWGQWSSDHLEMAAEAGPLYINTVIYAEAGGEPRRCPTSSSERTPPWRN